MRVAENIGASVSQRGAHAAHPGAVAGVELGDDLVLQQPVQHGGVAGVLGLVVGVDLAGQRPAVGAVVGLGPPAVQHRQLQAAVEHRLHAAGPGRLQRRTREVGPDVAAADQPRGAGEVVVGQEDDAALRPLRPAQVQQLLDQLLAGLVLGVRLAGDDQLHRPVAAQQAQRALRVVDHQPQALVGGDAAGEADRQHVGVEGHLAGLDERPLLPTPEPVARDPLADEVDQRGALLAAHGQQRRRRGSRPRPPTSAGRRRG